MIRRVVVLVDESVDVEIITGSGACVRIGLAENEKLAIRNPALETGGKDLDGLRLGLNLEPGVCLVLYWSSTLSLPEVPK